MGAEKLADLGQFAVRTPTGGQSQRPKAAKGARFLAAMIDGFAYAALGALSASVLHFAFHDVLTVKVWSSLIFPFLYFVLPLYTSGQTPGKKLMKLQVVNKDGGEDLGMFQCFLREVLGKSVSFFVLLLGYIWIFIDKDGRSWHDKIAGTKVISLKD